MSKISAPSVLKVIAFQLGDNEYALPIHQVQSIERLMPITRVPKTVPFIKGVINLRGVVTPIIDLRTRFGLPEKEFDDGTRIIVATLNEMEVGFIVDGANDVLDISEEFIEPQPEMVGEIEAEYITGVVKWEKRLLILLSLEKILEK
ncbi:MULTISPECIES: chemotaxis protein CheW [Bacillus]|jgi:purine-binding chemotaxis protein CheW|uniref:chemotaxis protein CheW n=1 Tax=Bacillus TaxID=1386 RepID=UPI00065E1CB8|nr:chemotaxis protein CheW [Bacillus smithii]AKP46886.1 Positive regulator of CheA protein activity CheW [Bacillus smithii]MED4882852.1 chemotaxis protein CheW [Bacillus smithii]MED4926883.1 chemotaxis protein CheW [Bacillus smithii]